MCAFILSGSARGRCCWETLGLGGQVVLCFLNWISSRKEKQRKVGACLNIYMHCQGILIWKNHPKIQLLVLLISAQWSTRYWTLILHPFNSTLWCKVELVRLPLTKQLVQQSWGPLSPLQEPWTPTGRCESPDPWTGDTGYWHDAAAFLHHHVNVSPHDLGDLPHLQTKQAC